MVYILHMFYFHVTFCSFTFLLLHTTLLNPAPGDPVHEHQNRAISSATQPSWLSWRDKRQEHTPDGDGFNQQQTSGPHRATPARKQPIVTPSSPTTTATPSSNPGELVDDLRPIPAPHDASQQTADFVIDLDRTMTSLPPLEDAAVGGIEQHQIPTFNEYHAMLSEGEAPKTAKGQEKPTNRILSQTTHQHHPDPNGREKSQPLGHAHHPSVPDVKLSTSAPNNPPLEENQSDPATPLTTTEPHQLGSAEEILSVSPDLQLPKGDGSLVVDRFNVGRRDDHPVTHESSTLVNDIGGGSVTDPSSTPIPSAPSAQTVTLRRNVAAVACGAKMLDSSKAIKNAEAILNGNNDEYMNAPCSTDKWFVIEVCEPVQLQVMEIANYELFSSRVKTFRVFVSDRYPAKMWDSIGLFTARDVKGLQTFDVASERMIKYVKFEMVEHYGSQHYCPLTMVRLFGLVADDLDYEDDDAGGVVADTAHPLPPVIHTPVNTEGDHLVDRGRHTETITTTTTLAPTTGTTMAATMPSSTSTGSRTSPTVQISPPLGSTISSDSSENLTRLSNNSSPQGTVNRSTNNEDLDQTSESNDKSVIHPPQSNHDPNTNDSSFESLDLSSPVRPYSVNLSQSAQLDPHHVPNLPPALDDNTLRTSELSDEMSLFEHARNVFAKFLIDPFFGFFSKQQKEPSSVHYNLSTVDLSPHHLSAMQSLSAYGLINLTHSSTEPSASLNEDLPLSSDVIIGLQSLNICLSELNQHIRSVSEHHSAQSHNSVIVKHQFLRLPKNLHLITPCFHAVKLLNISFFPNPSTADSVADYNLISLFVAYQFCRPTGTSTALETTMGSTASSLLCSTRWWHPDASNGQLIPRNAKICPKLPPFLLKLIKESAVHFKRSVASSPNSDGPSVPYSSTHQPNYTKHFEQPPYNNQAQTPFMDTIVVPAAYPGTRKDNTMMRLTNRVRLLERNVSVSMRYLEELSQSYRQQMDRLARSFNLTVAWLKATAQGAEERDQLQQVRITELEHRLEELLTRLRPDYRPQNDSEATLNSTAFVSSLWNANMSKLTAPLPLPLLESPPDWPSVSAPPSPEAIWPRLADVEWEIGEDPDNLDGIVETEGEEADCDVETPPHRSSSGLTRKYGYVSLPSEKSRSWWSPACVWVLSSIPWSYPLDDWSHWFRRFFPSNLNFLWVLSVALIHLAFAALSHLILYWTWLKPHSRKLAILFDIINSSASSNILLQANGKSNCRRALLSRRTPSVKSVRASKPPIWSSVGSRSSPLHHTTSTVESEKPINTLSASILHVNSFKTTCSTNSTPVVTSPSSSLPHLNRIRPSYDSGQTVPTDNYHDPMFYDNMIHTKYTSLQSISDGDTGASVRPQTYLSRNARKRRNRRHRIQLSLNGVTINQ